MEKKLLNPKKLSKWIPLTYKDKPINKSQLNLEISLFNGQAFTWFKNEDNSLFWGTCFNEFFCFRYSSNQGQNQIEYQYLETLSPSKSEKIDEKDNKIYNKGRNEEISSLLTSYFALDLDYSKFDKLAEKDEFFKFCYEKSKGMRVLRQDPWECFIAFLCSQNNNVKRIHQMVNNLCSNFGQPIFTFQGREFYTFPSIEKVADITEQELRDLGYGYRAAYVNKSSKMLKEKGGMKFLKELRNNENSEEVLQELRKFSGIGPKVADCISLFSLNCYDHVPMDTHMKKVYSQIYKQGKMKSNEIAQEFFRKKLGEWAGIAHSFLFTHQLENSSTNAKDSKKKSEKSLKRKNVENIKRNVGIKKIKKN